jgi:hypothetical protein
MIKQVDDTFVKENLGQFSTLNCTSLGSLILSGQHGISSVSSGTSNISLSDLQAKYPNNPMVQTRLRLENYLLVPRTPLARRYILQRLKGI